MTKAEGKEDSDQACREDTYQKRTHIRFLKEWPLIWLAWQLTRKSIFHAEVVLSQSFLVDFIKA